MRKKLYDEFVAECESSCLDMYIAWLEERVFALDAKVEKFTADNKQSTSASQIAASIQAACIFGNDFVPPRESWVREWIKQLRTL